MRRRHQQLALSLLTLCLAFGLTACGFGSSRADAVTSEGAFAAPSKGPLLPSADEAVWMERMTESLSAAPTAVVFSMQFPSTFPFGMPPFEGRLLRGEGGRYRTEAEMPMMGGAGKVAVTEVFDGEISWTEQKYARQTVVHRRPWRRSSGDAESASLVGFVRELLDGIAANHDMELVEEGEDLVELRSRTGSNPDKMMSIIDPSARATILLDRRTAYPRRIFWEVSNAKPAEVLFGPLESLSAAEAAKAFFYSPPPGARIED